MILQIWSTTDGLDGDAVVGDGVGDRLVVGDGSPGPVERLG